MRNSYSFLLFFGVFLLGASAKAQLYIDGAGFYIQNGATVTVQGNVTNNGTLTNNGNLRVQGDFLNSNQLVSTDNASVLEMYGTGNSSLNVGAALLKNLIINKATATDLVSLTADAQVTQGFTFTQGRFSTGTLANPNFILSSPTTATYSFVAGKEVVGNVRRTGWANGAAVVFNQENMIVTTYSGTAPTSITVSMIPSGDPSQAEREVKRKFNFMQTSGSGFTADVRYPYATSELNTNVENNLVPWKLVSAEWNAKTSTNSRNTVQHWVNSNGLTAADFAQEWKLADPNYTMNVTAYLRGPWNGANMSTSMNSGGIIPLSQPYNVAPYNYTGTESVAAIPANVVDWVLIENRKPASGLPQDALAGTITGSSAGFLLDNGTVVGIDGVTPITVPITKQGNSFVVVRHRNHLGVLSNVIASNAAGTFTNDFSALANVYKPSGAPSDPLTLLSGSVKYGLWPGDVNKNGVVNSTDITAVKAAISSSSSGYQLTDVNLNGGINSTDITLTKNTISLSGSGSGNRPANATGSKVAKTNIPDPIIED